MACCGGKNAFTKLDEDDGSMPGDHKATIPALVPLTGLQNCVVGACGLAEIEVTPAALRRMLLEPNPAEASWISLCLLGRACTCQYAINPEGSEAALPPELAPISGVLLEAPMVGTQSNHNMLSFKYGRYEPSTRTATLWPSGGGPCNTATNWSTPYKQAGGCAAAYPLCACQYDIKFDESFDHADITLWLNPCGAVPCCCRPVPCCIPVCPCLPPWCALPSWCVRLEMEKHPQYPASYVRRSFLRSLRTCEMVEDETWQYLLTAVLDKDGKVTSNWNKHVVSDMPNPLVMVR